MLLGNPQNDVFVFFGGVWVGQAKPKIRSLEVPATNPNNTLVVFNLGGGLTRMGTLKDVQIMGINLCAG